MITFKQFIEERIRTPEQGKKTISAEVNRPK